MDDISASRGGGRAGVSFVVCDRLLALVNFNLFANGISKGSELYGKVAELESGDVVILKGKMNYRGYENPVLTGGTEDTWTVKMEKGYVKHFLESKDSEVEEREVMGRFWFEVDIESLEVAP